MVHLSEQKKEQATIDLCFRTISVQKIADGYVVSRASLYKWKKQFLPEGSPTKMPNEIRQPSVSSEQIKKLSSGVSALSAEAASLKKEIYQLQLEKDVLQKAAEVIKKSRASVLIIFLTKRRL